MRRVTISFIALLTINIEANDLEEIPGKVTVVNDLVKVETLDNYVEKKPNINVTYNVPKSKPKNWQNFVKNLFNTNGNEN
jgi:hypothetical protein